MAIKDIEIVQPEQPNNVVQLRQVIGVQLTKQKAELEKAGQTITRTEQALAALDKVSAEAGVIIKPNTVNVDDYFQTCAAVQGLYMRRWLIRPLFQEDSTAVIVGNSESLKTFIGIYYSCLLANQGYKVMVIANEGQRGLLKRVLAYEKYYGAVSKENIFISSCDFDLSDGSNVSLLLDLAAQIKPAFIFVDTLNQTKGEYDENDSSDMGLYFSTVRKLKDAAGGACALVAHHLNKGGDFRGSMAIKNNIDTMIEAKRDMDKTSPIEVTCAKQKDAEHFKPIYFDYHKINIPELEEMEKTRPDYNPKAYEPEDFTSLVVEPIELTKNQRVNLSDALVSMLRYLNEVTTPTGGAGVNQADIARGASITKGTVSKKLPELEKLHFIEKLISDKQIYYKVSKEGSDYLAAHG